MQSKKNKKHPKVGKATINNLALNNRYLKFDQQSDKITPSVPN
jgi:hypothetical protein